MKKILAILFLGAMFSCQEAIEPEVIIEEVANSTQQKEVEIVIECFEEVVFEEYEILTEQEIEDEILVELEVEVDDIEIVEIVEEIRQN